MAKSTGFDLVSGDGFARLEHELKTLLERVKHKAHEVSQREFARKDVIRDWLDAECETCWRAPLIVRESATEVAIEVAVPGMTAENLTIGGKPGRLIVRGNKTSTSTRGAGAASVREYNSESLYREIALPVDADPARADIHVEHGVLTLKIARGAAQKTTPVQKSVVAPPKVEAKSTPVPAKSTLAPKSVTTTAPAAKTAKPVAGASKNKSSKSQGAGN